VTRETPKDLKDAVDAGLVTVIDLDAGREWTDSTNTTAAEQEANREVLEAIELSRDKQNTETEIAAILQIAQEASRMALLERKYDSKGTHHLLGEETTIPDVLTLVAILGWPTPAKVNGLHPRRFYESNII
jgi:hypothetical protein